MNHKGTQCPYTARPLLCQEGFCGDCQVFLGQDNKLTHLREIIEEKRHTVFMNSVYQPKHLKSQSRAMTDAYDIVLNLIKEETWKKVR